MSSQIQKTPHTPGSGQEKYPREQERTSQQENTREERETLKRDVFLTRSQEIMKDNIVPEEEAEREKNNTEGEKLKLFELIAFALVEFLDKGEVSKDSEIWGKIKDFFLNQDEEGDRQYFSELEANEISGMMSQERIDRREVTSEEEYKIRNLVVNNAHAVVNSKEFRGPEVRGGVLACGQVVSRILLNSGVQLSKEHLGVEATAQNLKRLGWVENPSSYTPRPGDVVIWNRTTRQTNDGNVALGHSHIGIVVQENLAISNSSQRKTPRTHPIGREEKDGYWRNRGVAMYLSPPG